MKKRDEESWFADAAPPELWSSAQKNLRKVNPTMRRLIDRVGPCTLAPKRDYFVVLCKAIFSQQISTSIATLLFGRFRDLFPRRRPTPARVLWTLTGGVPEERLAGVGLSRQKRAYLVDLAAHFVDGRIPTRSFATMQDEAVIESLTNVNGVGRWTAEMFLIFTLNREDVWPVDDLGLADGVRREYRLAARPTKRELVPFGEQFRPYRTVATWYFWRGADSKSKES